jgi:hypothetical protein
MRGINAMVLGYAAVSGIVGCREPGFDFRRVTVDPDTFVGTEQICRVTSVWGSGPSRVEPFHRRLGIALPNATVLLSVDCDRVYVKVNFTQSTAQDALDIKRGDRVRVRVLSPRSGDVVVEYVQKL